MTKNKEMLNFYGEHFGFMKKAQSSAMSLATTAAAGMSGIRVISRIKTPESMTKKILSDGFEINDISILEKESDAVGVRIITDSIVHVYDIVNNIHTTAEGSKKLRIVRVKDYIKNPKDSGYRSIHVIIAVKCGDPDFNELKVEIQVRTAIMDCWASLEHMTMYKQVVDVTPELTDMLETYSEEALKEIESAKNLKCKEVAC